MNVSDKIVLPNNNKFGHNNQYTLSAITSRFSIKLPDKADPTKIKELLSKLNNLLEEASFELAVSKTNKEQLEGISKTIKTKISKDLWQEKIKLGRKSNITKECIKDMSEAEAYSKTNEIYMSVVNQFNMWYAIVQNLRDRIQILHQVTWNNGILEKAHTIVPNGIKTDQFEGGTILSKKK